MEKTSQVYQIAVSESDSKPPRAWADDENLKRMNENEKEAPDLIFEHLENKNKAMEEEDLKECCGGLLTHSDDESCESFGSCKGLPSSSSGRVGSESSNQLQ